MRAAVVLAAFLGLATPYAAGQGLPLLFHEDFESGVDRWQPTDPKAWKVTKQGSTNAFHQFGQSKYTPPFRSPLNIAWIKDLSVADFVLEAKALSAGKDVAHRD